MALKVSDIRADMPNYNNYKNKYRKGKITGIAIHHSAVANRATGAPAGTALTYFKYHVNTRGWDHGGYNYVITGNGKIEYALDERISAYHAGFKDPGDTKGLERGQYWNNHYLAICLSGWFSKNRTYRDEQGRVHTIPDNYTSPTQTQTKLLIALIQHLRQKYGIPVENVRGHREMAGNNTICPGYSFDPAELRAKLRADDKGQQPKPTPPTQPEVAPGEHVLLLPDTDKYLQSAMAYIWKFQPDVSFAIDEARGRWKYITVVGNRTEISGNQFARLHSGGVKLMQRIVGDPQTVQATLDKLTENNTRFLTDEPPHNSEPPVEEEQTYTVQPGDTLSLIARQIYGKAQLWNIIFEANRNILTKPSRIRTGQILKIPAVS